MVNQKKSYKATRRINTVKTFIKNPSGQGRFRQNKTILTILAALVAQVKAEKYRSKYPIQTADAWVAKHAESCNTAGCEGGVKGTCQQCKECNKANREDWWNWIKKHFGGEQKNTRESEVNTFIGCYFPEAPKKIRWSMALSWDKSWLITEPGVDGLPVIILESLKVEHLHKFRKCLESMSGENRYRKVYCEQLDDDIREIEKSGLDTFFKRVRKKYNIRKKTLALPGLKEIIKKNIGKMCRMSC